MGLKYIEENKEYIDKEYYGKAYFRKILEGDVYSIHNDFVSFYTINDDDILFANERLRLNISHLMTYTDFNDLVAKYNKQLVKNFIGVRDKLGDLSIDTLSTDVLFTVLTSEALLAARQVVLGRMNVELALTVVIREIDKQLTELHKK